jgi:N-acetyl-anhydromuramyl-L-alanine amidase AmpD
VNLGRDVNIAGAHVSGYNPHSIGVVYVGGLENDPKKAYKDLKAKDTRTDAQKASLLALLMDLRKLYPTAVIQGHRDFSPDKNHNGTIEPSEWIKDCPSFDAKQEYEKI